MRIETVGIIGRGALGAMYGMLLAEGIGKDNVFFITDEKRAAGYLKEGMFYNGTAVKPRYEIPGKSERKADLLIFALKFPTLEEALQAAKPFTGEKTILLSVMNGIESEAVIGKALGWEHLLYCMVHSMDAVKEGNRFRVTTNGTVVFGDLENKMTEDVLSVKELLNRAGIQYEIPEDIMKRMWSKLMLNCAVNQVAAVYGTGFGGLQKAGRERDMVKAVMAEVRMVAAAEGVVLTERDIAAWMAVIDNMNPEGIPSMQQDVQAGRETEVELFAGTVIRLGRRYQVPTPLNQELYVKIKS